MDASLHSGLNAQQLAAATAPADRPVLIIAGAGTGKTNTLAHRVAHLLDAGIDPSRLLLMTFSRRASAEMLRRVAGLLRHRGGDALSARIWGGTFHAVAHRLLRMHGESIGLGQAFTVVDRSDAEDLLHDVRGELKLDRNDVRFPQKSTCLAIYSRCVNAQEPIEQTLREHFPWCAAFPEQLRALFRAFTQRKQAQNVLDYDDLLLYWFHLMQDPALAGDLRARFDAVLVDEYQDTNLLQAGILRGLRPDGRGLTVVGDDAQSIYAFRAATVANILEFPRQFPGAAVLKLEENYRSVQPILDAANAVIALAPRRHEKTLFSSRGGRQRPRLVSLLDEQQQCDHVIARVLEHREAGIPLRRQAVLFRTAHHSDALEVELSRRGIPFVKYGGLKFLEAAHVKDALAILRLAENPRDSVSALRVLQLLDGVGPAHARRAIAHLEARRFDLRAWQDIAMPPTADEQWPQLVDLLLRLAPNDMPLAEQLADVARFYRPILQRRYDQSEIRARDIDQLERIAGNFASRGDLLSELTLDPPASTQDLAGAPLLEEDYLILSTIHSAKGCEWDCVYLLHAADGNIPSDMSSGSDEQIEEERRLLYVAMTRARDFLEVCFPLKYYAKKRALGDRHSYAQLTRFLPDDVLRHFELVKLERAAPGAAAAPAVAGVDVRRKVAAMWE